MSLIVIAVCAGVAASLGYLAARRRSAPPAPGDEPASVTDDGPGAGSKARSKPASAPPVAPKPARTKPSKEPAPASPFEGLPLALGDVVSAEREERWLAGVLIARDGGRVHSALFVAPEGARLSGVAVFAPPRKDVYWLEQVEVDAPDEPPATIEIHGATLSRRARIPVALERQGQGAPAAGETGIWASYEGSGRDVALVITSGGKVHAWSGVRFDEGEYDRLGGGGD